MDLMEKDDYFPELPDLIPQGLSNQDKPCETLPTSSPNDLPLKTDATRQNATTTLPSREGVEYVVQMLYAAQQAGSELALTNANTPRHVPRSRTLIETAQIAPELRQALLAIIEEKGWRKAAAAAVRPQGADRTPSSGAQKASRPSGRYN